MNVTNPWLKYPRTSGLVIAIGLESGNAVIHDKIDARLANVVGNHPGHIVVEGGCAE